MPDKHREIHFEEEICEHLADHGWLYSADDTGYDAERALFPEDLIGWLADTQKPELSRLRTLQNGGTTAALMDRVVKLLETDGTVSVLRHSFKHLNAKFDLCQFKPAHGLNPETLDRYAKVRLRVMRQVHYSTSNRNSIDLILFVNGIPVATLELKTEFTQTVDNAIWQYKKDRPPKDPVTKKAEPLLTFKRGALVHFAVSTDEVHMTTELKGAATRFLPFNLGYEEGKGNPPNPGGYATSYLWERILQRDHWLQILGSFVHLEENETVDRAGKKRTSESLIFPRFHQWEAVTRLIAASREEGPGHTYLVQHSAGSGKTNSISWLAHQLSSLHDHDDRRVFDSVLVITDRTVLDRQLQDAIYQFEHKHGVVARITDKEGSKSEKLVAALDASTPIIIVTLQTFPHVMGFLREAATLKDRRFAVIVDEAHSSMSGSAAHNLHEVLGMDATPTDGDEEVTADDVVTAEAASRGLPPNASFYAFTATPKDKTLQVFGRVPDPSQPPSNENRPRAFHMYSMRQAIQEGFILDVLANYTAYKAAWKLAHNGKEYDARVVDATEGVKQLVRWVRLHPYNIRQKVEIIVDHFRRSVLPTLDGQAKAMVVTGSRTEAVRYKLAIDKYIREQGYKDVAALVAFSGEVSDPENGRTDFSETNMNDLHGLDIRDALDGEDYNVLLVANKYQTGFDQPKLVAMYVDKKLTGVAAVQTLSRLNRVYPGKERTFILDFVNDPDEIRLAFEPYYREAHLGGVSDPNVVHDIQSELDAEGIYTDAEVEAYAQAFFDPKGTQAAMQAAVGPAVQRYRDRFSAAEEHEDRERVKELELFRKKMGAFVRAYDFLSQIFEYQDTDLEKRYAFYKGLIPQLAHGRDKEPIDLSGVELTHYRVWSKGHRKIVLGADEEDHTLTPLTDAGSGVARDPLQVQLDQLIRRLNELFEGDLSDADKVTYVNHLKSKLLENDALAEQARNNSKEQFALGDFNKAFLQVVVEGLNNYESMAGQVLKNDRLRTRLGDMLRDLVYEEFVKRGRGGTPPAA